jgi:uncharacterized protein
MTQLTAPYELAYPYKRSLGAVLGVFFGGLKQERVFGVRLPDGRVAVPPIESDPVTGAACTDMVEVGTTGVVQHWTWEPNPRAGKHTLDVPFAWALVLLDGADTPMLHVVDAGTPETMAVGLRVAVRWAAEKSGGIRDIVCFAPSDQTLLPEAADAPEPLGYLVTPIKLDYTIQAGNEMSAFLLALEDRRIVGRRCPGCEAVFVPPRGGCTVCSLPAGDEVQVAEVGTVTTFCIINIPFEGQMLEPPYVCAAVLLDGSDLPLFHLIGGLPVEEARMGMRVKAVWGDPAPTLASIRYFAPTGEPDAAYDTYKEHL